MSGRFEPGRADGRSQVDVVCEVIHDVEPGQIIAYETLQQALEEGTDRTFERRAIQRIVGMAQGRLLRAHQRAVSAVARRGYRVALAGEHTQLAHVRKRKSDLQIRRGLALLREVRWNELEPMQRQIHEGHLMLLSGLYAQQRSFDRRQREMEQTLEALKVRVDKHLPLNEPAVDDGEVQP